MLSRSRMVRTLRVRTGDRLSEKGPRTDAAYRPVAWDVNASRPCPVERCCVRINAAIRMLTGAAKHQAEGASRAITANTCLTVADAAAVDGLGRGRIVCGSRAFGLAPVDAASAGAERRLLGAREDLDRTVGVRRAKADLMAAVLDAGVARDAHPPAIAELVLQRGGARVVADAT